MASRTKERAKPADDQPLTTPLHFPGLRIQGFRAFKDLSIRDLGRVNLITGENNTGKTSILEALRLYAHKGALPVILEILDAREELTYRDSEAERPSSSQETTFFSSLFYGFPQLDRVDDVASIAISNGGPSSAEKVSIKFDWFLEQEDSEGFVRLVDRESSELDGEEHVAALTIAAKGGRAFHRLENIRNRPFSRNYMRRFFGEAVHMPCRFVSSYSGQQTGDVAYLWDETSLTQGEDEVTKALQILEPRIAGASMVGDEGRFSKRKAIVRNDAFARPMPLRSLGDGSSRLFALALSLVNARGGILLIDEFENGLHYSAMRDVWGMIFRLAMDLNVQVFATTHSWDAVTSFGHAAEEAPDNGALLRLRRKGDRIIATVATEEQLAIAIRHDIEVR